MTQELWSAVDRWLDDVHVGADEALDAALRANAAAGLPAIDVTPTQGKMLHVLARAINARRILEIGTLGGTSTIWMARAVGAEGRVITLEKEPRHAEVARANIARAGLASLVDVRVGPALDSLETLAGEPPFDLVFIDADKPNNPRYLEWALRLTRPGSLIVGDNVIRRGEILDASGDASARGTREFHELLAREPRVIATAIQTVGAKGHDGFALALVVAPRV